VPTDAPKSFGEQLAAALNDDRAGRVSQRELAKRLAEADGKSRESKRRWIAKLLVNEVELPEPESIAAIEAALGKEPGFFVVSRPGTVSRAGRRGELAATLGEVIEAQVRMDGQIRRLQRRVRALEAGRGGGEASAKGPQ
jgi:hypothetical protein